MTYTHRYSITPNNFTALKTSCVPPVHPFSSFPEPLATTDLFIVSIVLLSSDCHEVGIIQHGGFLESVLLLSNMHLRFLHVLWLDSSFLFITE